MTATRIHSILLASFAAVMLVTTGAGVTTVSAQTADDQKCINGINKAALKVAATVGKQTAKCVKNATKGKEPDADACVDGDTKGKIGKAVGKVTSTESKSCTVAPPFGYTSAAIAAQAAEDAERALARIVFGATINAAMSTDKTIGGCQGAVIKAAEKLASTVGKDFLKCKKDGLKGGTITSNAGIEACVGVDTKSKIAKAKQKLLDSITKKCGGVTLSAAFPGDCSADTGNCVNARAVGQTCAAINGIDGVNANCDLIDDGVVNGSSPTCGNNLVDAGEACDDGNTVDDGNGCDESCQDNSVCGDGITQGIFEACDDAGESATCDADCTSVACGDGTLNVTAGETCDDGAANGTGEGSCIGDCSTVQVCGDSVVNGTEQCDDGNTTDDGNGCGTTCMFVQNSSCPDQGTLTFYAQTSQEPCASTADCTTAGHPGTCNLTLGVCETESILDSGWTGVSHGGDVIDLNQITGNLLCPGGGAPGPCGECIVEGVNSDSNNCRCSQDTTQRCDVPFDFDGATGARGCGTGVTCSADADCKYCTGDPSVKCNVNNDCTAVGGTCFGGSPRLTCNTSAGMCEGICNCYLGTPLPLSAGNTPVCVVNRLTQDVSGTANVDSGSGAFEVSLRAIVYLSDDKYSPCPTCAGSCSAPVGSKCTSPLVNQGNVCTVNSDCDSSPGNGVCRSSLGNPCFLDSDCDINAMDGDGVCSGFDPTPGDGVKGGTCFGGEFDGAACDIDGVSTSFPAFPGTNGGGHSLDCFPSNGTNITGQGLRIALSPSTGTKVLAANVDCGGLLGGYGCFCKTCSGDTSIACNSNAECASAGAGTCTSNGGGVAPRPNDCDPNGTGGDGNVGSCVTLGGADEFGECADPSDDLYSCDGVVRANGEGFVACEPSNRECSDGLGGQGPTTSTGCLADADCFRCSGNNAPCADATDCPALQTCDDTGVTCEYTDCILGGLPPAFDPLLSGDCVLAQQRRCFLDPIKSVGLEDPNAAIGVAQFCIPATINAGVNGVAGLPGPGRAKLQVSSDLTCPDGLTTYTPGVGGCP